MKAQTTTIYACFVENEESKEEQIFMSLKAVYAALAERNNVFNYDKEEITSLKAFTEQFNENKQNLSVRLELKPAEFDFLFKDRLPTHAVISERKVIVSGWHF